jgi:CheY-like chemotaxis protein
VELLRHEMTGHTASTHESLRSITRAAQDGAALVRKIQAYLRHEKRERFETVDLAALVSEVVTLTRPYWYNEPRRQGIAIELDADLSPVPSIQGYPTELREVMVNLVLNAVQAMPAGGSISLSCRRDPAREAAIVEIGDTGVGMPERVLRRIFEPLYTTKGENGTGMGLSVAYGIVQEHGGRIEVESEPGQGSLFRLVLPYAPASAEKPSPKPLPAANGLTPLLRSNGAPQNGAARRALRLLVVDDEPMVRTITKRLLGLRGHDVIAVHGGLQALDVMGDDAFDCVVTDLSMPEMNGRELASKVRDLYPCTPVILLTGDTDPDVEHNTVSAVMRKPFNADKLDTLLQEIVANGPGGR